MFINHELYYLYMLITIKALILKAWDLYLDNFKKLWTLLLLSGLITLLGSMTNILINRELVGTARLIMRVLTSAIFYAGTLLVTVSFIFALSRLMSGGEINIKEILKTALQKFPLALLVSAAAGLIMVGGFVLLIIPGFIFTVWYSFAIYQTLLDNHDLEQSLRHSHNLSRHRFWPVFWRILLPNAFWSIAIWLLAYSIITVTDRIIGGQLLSSATPPLPIVILLTLITDVLSVLAAPLFVGTGLVLYHSLKETSKV